jgi:hypothetical protein
MIEIALSTEQVQALVQVVSQVRLIEVPEEIIVDLKGGLDELKRKLGEVT